MITKEELIKHFSDTSYVYQNSSTNVHTFVIKSKCLLPTRSLYILTPSIQVDIENMTLKYSCGRFSATTNITYVESILKIEQKDVLISVIESLNNGFEYFNQNVSFLLHGKRIRGTVISKLKKKQTVLNSFEISDTGEDLILIAIKKEELGLRFPLPYRYLSIDKSYVNLIDPIKKNIALEELDKMIEYYKQDSDDKDPDVEWYYNYYSRIKRMVLAGIFKDVLQFQPDEE